MKFKKRELFSGISVVSLSKFLRKAYFSILIATLAAIVILSVSRFLFGPGEANPFFSISGRYVGEAIYDLMYFACFLLLFAWKSLTKIGEWNFGDEADQKLEHKTFRHKRIFFCNFLCFILAISIFLQDKNQNLYIGVDGDYSRAISKNQLSWGGAVLDLGMNFLQGMGGNIWFPINSRIDLGYISQNLPVSLPIESSYVCWALLLHLSTYFLAQRLGMRQEISLVASWISPFIILMPSVFQLSTVPQLIPHIATAISINSLILGICVGSIRRKSNFFNASIPLFFLTTYFVLVNPTFVFLAIPFNLFVIISLFMIHYRKENWILFSMFILLPIVLSLSISYRYLHNLLSGSAASVFQDEYLTGPKSLRSISILFSSPNASVIYLISILCLVYLIGRSSYMSGRSIYISTMCFLGVILVSGFIFVSNPEIWKGPAPNYFEFFLWPWFAIFVSVVICWVLSNFLSGLRKKIPVISYFNNLSILTATFTFMVVLLSQMQIPSQRSWNFPAEENSIFKVIEKTRVVPGDVFKGRVMTFTGMNLPVGINWSDLQKFDYGTSFSKFGSDFRKADLWYKNIPTLTEYSQTLSATSFQFLRAMFGKQGDGQIRNIMTLRRINLAGLRLVGVKYIVTDLPQKNLKLLTEMSNQSTKFYVYEIQEVNTQGYSPTFVKNVVSNKHALRIIKTRELDYRREALVDRKYSLKSLVAMNSSSLKVLRNGYNVKANTSGTSLLVLPIEFSNCFVVRDRVKQENYFEILPVNYGMLGILFSEDIDLTLEYKFGLFQNQNCRVKDKKRILEL